MTERSEGKAFACQATYATPAFSGGAGAREDSDGRMPAEAEPERAGAGAKRWKAGTDIGRRLGGAQQKPALPATTKTQGCGRGGDKAKTLKVVERYGAKTPKAVWRYRGRTPQAASRAVEKTRSGFVTVNA